METRPHWLAARAPDPAALEQMEKLFDSQGLHTVCRHAQCPNIGRCFNAGTATFMILGHICTRGCRFCAVGKGIPSPADEDEPARVARAVKELGLKHAVITSVTRDDLPDGGAGQFAGVIGHIRKTSPGTTLEVLIPDFKGDPEALRTVADACPDVINHNLETVPRLYRRVRPLASYSRSLGLLESVRHYNPAVITKSGLMVGLGETENEVVQVFNDLLGVGCHMLTVGQYLSPSRNHLPVEEYIAPQRFDRYKKTALVMGFRYVAAGPLVRSSFQAIEGIRTLRGN